MLSYFNDIPAAYVNHRAPNALCGVDNNVIVLGHVKCVQSLDLFTRPIEYTFINRIRHTIIYELRQYQPIFAVVKHFEGIGRKWQPVPDIGIPGQHCIDVPCEFCPLILVDCVCDIG